MTTVMNCFNIHAMQDEKSELLDKDFTYSNANMRFGAEVSGDLKCTFLIAADWMSA